MRSVIIDQPSKGQLRSHIRWMIRRDIPEVLRIENRSFDLAWGEGDFIRCLRQRNCIGMVAEAGDCIAGFMVYELHKTKLHILNFAIDPDLRRSGIGTQMADKLIGKLTSHRRARITLTVRESNLGAQMFFRAQGFRAARILHGYFEDCGEDAYLMNYSLAAGKEGGQ